MRIGIGDTHDPSCPWYCSSFCSGFGPPPMRTTCGGFDCTACQCANNEIWNPATFSCVSTSLAVPPTAPSLAPCSAGTPGAMFTGNDSAGNPLYLCQSTPQQDQASTLAAQQAAAAAAGDAAEAADCSAWYNTFNSKCAGSWNPFVIGGAVALGIVLVILLTSRK